ncbi:MAG: conjugal transfer protein [Sulfolobus sp.]
MIFYPLTYGTLDGVIMAIIDGLSLYLLRKYSKKQKGGIEGDLVVPWSQVRAIVVTNVRQENVANRPSFVLNIISPTYKEIGDWHALTVDGRDITILDVDDPINKLNYVKVKFNLKF